MKAWKSVLLAVAVLNLLRLSQMANQSGWRQMAERAIKAFEQEVSGSPGSVPQMMVALNFYLDKPKQILIAGERGTEGTLAILQEVHKRFIPNKVVLLADGNEGHKRLAGGLEVLDSTALEVELRPTFARTMCAACPPISPWW